MELHEQQRQQAIRDLEALLQPGALKARIEQVCFKVLIFFLKQCFRTVK